MTPEMECLLTIIRHRESLNDSLHSISDELQRRARMHDRDKLELPKFDGFAAINATAREHPYGSDKYRESLRAQRPVIESHYAVSPHHPDYHACLSDMSFLDIIEMVADWKAAADTYGNTGLRQGLSVHRERFQFSDAQWWLIEQVITWLEFADL